MKERTITYGLHPPWTAGIFLRLWLSDLVFAVEYWALRGIQAGLTSFRLLFRPVVMVSGLLLLGGAGLAALVQDKLICGQRAVHLDLKAIADGAQLFRIERHRGPASLQELVPKYIRELRRDPWGNNYVLFHGPGGLAVVSAGPDRELGTVDDIVRVVPPPAKAQAEMCPPTMCANTLPSDGTMEALGCPRIRPALGGFQIVDLRPGALTEAGIQKGDVVTAVNGYPMTPDEALKSYAGVRDAQLFEIDLIREKHSLHLRIDRALVEARVRNP